MFDEGVLGNGDRFIGLDEVDQSLIGQIEVKGVRVIEVVFGDVYLALIDV